MGDYQRGGNPVQVNPAPRKHGGDGHRRADGGGYGARLKSGLFWFVILAIGVYCYLHPAAIRSWLDKAGLVKIQADGGTAPIAADELATISNALNEALEKIEEWEFQTRMGATRAEAEELLAALGRI